MWKLKKISFLIVGIGMLIITGCSTKEDKPLLIDNSISSWTDNVQELESLINKWADIEAKNEDGDTPLISATRWNLFSSRHWRNDIVETLLKHWANVNHQNNDGLTALMYACMNGDKEIVKLLLDHWADANTIKSGWITALSNSSEYPDGLPRGWMTRTENSTLDFRTIYG